MIYNQTRVAQIIEANIKELNFKIEKFYKMSFSQQKEKQAEIDHLTQWKDKNIKSLHNWGYISDSDMEAYKLSTDYYFTPEIHIQ